jgi:uncharacterized protein (DUF58 family)
VRYLDPVALATLRNLRLELRRLAAEGASAGRHRSLVKGLSQDFAQHRPYVPGDELKSLDWKVYARQDRYYVREYTTETALTTHVLLDVSGSMGFSAGGRRPKFEHAAKLAMAVAYLVLQGGDAVGLTTFAEGPKRLAPPRSSLTHLELMDTILAETVPAGETDLGRALERAASDIKRRSLVVLISDLLGEPERILKVVRSFKARRHELLVLQVLDPQEREFDFDGPTVFESLEGQPDLFCEAGALRQMYRAEFDRLLKLYEGTFHRSDVAYAPFFTDTAWELALGRFLTRWQ